MDFSLQDFNARQKEAITTTDGPLLVISGAGTGKTHVLTGKVLYLLLEKGVNKVAPTLRRGVHEVASLRLGLFEEILCLTFTEKATAEMVSRIDAALPIGHPDIWIKTFHAFCDSVLRERGHEIGIPMEYKILQDADLFQFLRHHITEFHFEYYRSLGNPEKFLRAMQEYFSRLKDEDISVEAYLEFCKNLTSETKTKHLELARAYETYENLLLKNGYLDFGGLLHYTLRLFEKRPSVLAEYAKRFRYILVDEFQDTNFAQNKIVTLLAQHHGNITVVGDDDQSIYKWRGASLTNIQYFEKNFPQARHIVLNENYRSPQTILDLAYSVIQKNNPERLEMTKSIDKRLKSLPRPSLSEALTSVFHFHEVSDEIAFVVSRAAENFKKGLDTAILVRTNALGLSFAERLQEELLPYQHFASGTLFTKAGVKDCIALLRVLANPWDDMALFRLLSLSFWNISMESLLGLLKQAKSNGFSLFQSLKSSAFKKPRELLDRLIEFSRTANVSEVLGKFLNESGYLKSSQNNSEILNDIARFSEKVSQFEATHGEKTVTDFLTYAQSLEEFGESRNLGETLDPNAIKVLTIHGAKGLEFDAVYIPGLVAGKFPGISRRDPFEIPEELIPEPLPKTDHHMAEERRLFYVGLTRAKQTLTLSYSDFYDGKRQWKVSPFVLESLESGKALPGILPKKFLRAKQQKALPFEEAPSGRAHRPLKFSLTRLSYTQLDTFRTCPLKYQFRYILHVPAPMPPIVNFGSSLHNTLRDFYAFLQKNPDRAQEDLRPVLKKFYEKHWIPGGYESRAIGEAQKKLGHETLERFYTHEKKNLIIPKFLEKSFTIKMGNMEVTGRIDRVDQLPDGTFEVVDYKSGSSSEKNLSKDLQLSIYALACKEVLKIPVSRLSLYYLENLEKVSTTRTSADLETCRNEIIKCAEEIRASDFSPTPGFHCRFCDFRLICPVAAPMVK